MCVTTAAKRVQETILEKSQVKKAPPPDFPSLLSGIDPWKGGLRKVPTRRDIRRQALAWSQPSKKAKQDGVESPLLFLFLVPFLFHLHFGLGDPGDFFSGGLLRWRPPSPRPGYYSTPTRVPLRQCMYDTLM